MLDSVLPSLSPPSLGRFLPLICATFQEPWAPVSPAWSSSYRMNPGLAGQMGKERRHALAVGVHAGKRLHKVHAQETALLPQRNCLLPRVTLLDTKERVSTRGGVRATSPSSAIYVDGWAPPGGLHHWGVGALL